MNNMGIIKNDYTVSPQVSIIIPAYNCRNALEQTILSILNQTFASLELIRKYDGKIDYWVSEPDAGIYDAMNKGVSISKGCWVYFIGAGDTLTSENVLQNIFGCWKETYNGIDLIIGDVSSWTGLLNSDRVSGNNFHSLKLRNTLHHQGTFYRRLIFNTFRFNADYLVSADYELNLILLLSKAKHCPVPTVVANHVKGGVSSQILFKGYCEVAKIRYHHMSFFEATLYNMITMTQYAIKRTMQYLRQGWKAP